MKWIARLRSSYSTKLIVFFTLLNFFCILLSSGSFYILQRNQIYDNYSISVDDTAAQIRTEIDRKMDEIKRIADTFIFDQSFHTAMAKTYTGLERQNFLNDYLLPKEKTALVLSDMRLALQLYLKNDTIPEYYYIRSEDSSAPVHKKFEVFHADRITDQAYYRELYAQPDFIVWKQVEDDAEQGAVSLLAKLTNFSGNSDCGVLRMVVSLEELFGNTIPENFQQAVYYSIADETGKLVYSNREMPELSEEPFRTETKLSKGGYTVRLAMPRSNISQGLSDVLRNVNLIALACFLVTFLMALGFRRILYHNINSIVDGIREFQKGNYETRIENVGTDEFASIATAFNGMAQSTEHLVNDVYEVLIQKQDAELQMLQAKINPHFMYNIFSIISQLAGAGKDEDIMRIVQKTSRFYRRALSKRTDGNTLADELAILDDYFDIIEIQRPGAIRKTYHIEEGLADCLVPNFILQPIVENAVKHAMVDGRIGITVEACRRDGDVCITVADDGIGMTEEQREELFKFRPGSGYGLYNISARMRLRYSDPKYDISCQSEYGKGTSIGLVLPFETKLDEEMDENV